MPLLVSVIPVVLDMSGLDCCCCHGHHLFLVLCLCVATMMSLHMTCLTGQRPNSCFDQILTIRRTLPVTIATIGGLLVYYRGLVQLAEMRGVCFAPGSNLFSRMSMAGLGQCLWMCHGRVAKKMELLFLMIISDKNLAHPNCSAKICPSQQNVHTWTVLPFVFHFHFDLFITHRGARLGRLPRHIRHTLSPSRIPLAWRTLSPSRIPPA